MHLDRPLGSRIPRHPLSDPLRGVGARLRRQAVISAALGGLLVSVAGLSVVTAADPFVAGQPAARPMAVPDGGQAAVAAARRLLASVGLPVPATVAAERLADRLESATYDDVTFRDARGRPVLLVRLGADGSLRHLTRLEAPDPGARTVPEALVPGRASAVARAAGLHPAGVPAISDDPSGGWGVAWGRIEAGAPVLGDGIWVRLDPNGAVRSVASIASRLDARPSTVIAEPDARRIAERELDRLVAAEMRAGIHIAAARLAWVAPNDTFDAARPDAPEPLRRLAWVVRAAASGPAAERLRGLELDIDAGTGRLLGGDALE